MVFGAGFYTYTVSALSGLLLDINTRESKLHKNITVTDEFCKETNLTRSLRNRIREALDYNSKKSIFGKSERDEFFKEIPIGLKYKVA